MSFEDEVERRRHTIVSARISPSVESRDGSLSVTEFRITSNRTRRACTRARQGGADRLNRPW